MGVIYYETEKSKYERFVEHSIAFSLMRDMIEEKTLITGVPYKKILADDENVNNEGDNQGHTNNSVQIPTMGGLRIFVGSQTTQHGPRIKVSNLKQGKNPFSSRSKYDEVFFDNGEVIIGSKHGKRNLKYERSDIEQITAFYMRNKEDISANREGIINDTELASRIKDTEMEYYKKNVLEKNIELK